MQTASQPCTVLASDVAALSSENIAKLVNDQSTEIATLRHQLEWFNRQIFGQKSERRLVASSESQLSLGEEFTAKSEQLNAGKKTRIAEHDHTTKPKDESSNDESALFFDESKVPVETIYLDPVTATGLNKDEFEIISEKITYRLAQRPGSYVVTKYIRPVLKLRETGTLVSIPAPEGIIKGSRADVSFQAGIVVDKFAYHQPLYRLHRKLTDQGFKLSRQWLTQLMQQTIEALIPIFDAQFDSIRRSRVKCMDETPIKAGVASPGKMKAAYFWPVYGELDEICFKFYPDRSAKNVEHALGLSPPKDGVLLTDGYAAYKQYAKKVGLTHAQCWAHTRRKFFDSQDIEPERAKEALDRHDAWRVVELFADIFANACELATTAAGRGVWLVTEFNTRQIHRSRQTLGLLAIFGGHLLRVTQRVKLDFYRSNVSIECLIKQACLCCVELLRVPSKAPTPVDCQLLSELINLGLAVKEFTILIIDRCHQRESKLTQG